MALVMPVARLIIERGHALGGSAAIDRLAAQIGQISLNHQLRDVSVADDTVLHGRLHSRGLDAVRIHGELWPAGCWIGEDAVTFRTLPNRQILQLRERHEPGTPLGRYLQLGSLSAIRTTRMTTIQFNNDCWLRIWFDPADIEGIPFEDLVSRLRDAPTRLAA